MSRSRRPAVDGGSWLVVSAWAPEVAPLRSGLRRLAPATRRHLVLGTVGVGLVESAMGAARLIAAHTPGAVLLVGTAGVYPGHEHEFPLGSAALVTDAVLLPHLGKRNAAYLPDLVPARVQCSAPLVGRLRRDSGAPLAAVACPLAITADRALARTAARRSGCALENLEVFAVARAASSAGVPFAAILGIANHVGPGGRREWRQHARTAAAAACAALLSGYLGG